jgi:LuxR family maltose regulon positive regulatory protein
VRIAVEELTSRERVVLEWLTSSLTLARIGQELFVSLDTMKSHVRHIYRKLGVSSRGEAIERARALNFLRDDAVA